MTTIFCPMVDKFDYGGGVKSTIALMNGLASHKKFEVYVMLHPNSIYASKFHPNIEIDYFQSPPQFSFKKIGKFLALTKYVKKHILKHQLQKGIIFCSDRPALMMMIGMAKKSENVIHVARGGAYQNLSSILLKVLLFPYVKHFIAISNHQASLLEKIISKNKVSVIFNGVHSSQISREKFKNKSIKIGVLGALSSIKNQFQAAKMMKYVGEKLNLSLYFFGKEYVHADFEYAKNLKKYIEDNHIKNIHFHPYEHDVQKVYKKIDIHLSTSITEGFGRTLVEAMSYGVPVIANKVAGGPLSIIEPNHDGLIYDGSLDDLIEKITLLVNDKKMQQKFINNGKVKYNQLFTEQVMVNNYISLFSKLDTK